MYYPRLIDKYLAEWAMRTTRKPLLLRGARQVGKSTAVRHLGERFERFVEVNFEKQPSYITLFQGDIDVKRIVPQMAALAGKTIEPGKTLLFLDEIQACPQAIMALRFFKEDLPDLHVVAAGSLLEFALEELPTFGVGRIHSMFMFPMTFDEFLLANGEELLMGARNSAAGSGTPLPEPLYRKLTDLLRTYMLVGGMPEVVGKWVETHDYLACQEVQDDLVVTYEDDFPKYRKKVDPVLLRLTMRSAAVQATRKFVYSGVGGGYAAHDVKKALEMLTMAGILIPVTCTSANGLPLGSEADKSYRKMLLLDTGLMLRLLNMTTGDISELTEQILASDVAELVNKGPMAEMVAGLELLHYRTPNIRHDMYYWLRQAKNSQAEVDYISSYRQAVLPIEVKAGTQGGMKSLWLFMREKHLTDAVRCSLENFGTFDYTDKEDSNAIRHVQICPLYAISQMESLLQNL
ncbi:MAG: ATP-binding protein [Acidaminococcaceae bacterium]|nr:ATP-binding protein [Acidaminococcaceae bacterium]